MFFFQNAGTSKQQGSSPISKSLSVSLEHRETPNTVTRGIWNKYTYKKISDLVEPENKVNIYGMIHTIVKVKVILNLSYIVCSY
jgi:hypothetical protein